MEHKPITISFKQTPEEIALYRIISEHSSKGAFIKDILIETLVKKSHIDNPKNPATNIEDMNNRDELSEILDI